MSFKRTSIISGRNLSFELISFPMLHRVKQVVILRYRSNGCKRWLEQYPTERKDHDREPDLPTARRMRTPPDQRQCQRSHTTNCDDDKRFSEIPFESVFSTGWAGGRIEKFAAVSALYCRVLNLLSTVRALLHSYFFCLNPADEVDVHIQQVLEHAACTRQA